MKYLKQFEELNPETYISAGNKMRDKYQPKRGDKLIDYGVKKQRENSYKQELASEYKYNILIDGWYADPIIYQCKFLDYKIWYNADDIEDLIDSNYEIRYDITFIFEATDGSKIIPFDFVYSLYTEGKGKKGNRKFINTIRIESSDYDNHEEFDENEVSRFGGIFADRRSAVLFLREIVSTIPDDPEFNMSEILGLLKRPSDELDEIYNKIDISNIDIHYLYGDDDSSLEKRPIITKN